VNTHSVFTVCKMPRANDPLQKTFYQTERFFTVNRQWYFSTREAPESGPFDSRAEAEQELKTYLRTHLGVKTDAWDIPGANR